ncbi:MAG: 1-acyl-sn-glycerol-3-phosphate acyltransferase [Proteobacteria bacterium]|nr:1-acyl-sn-glycerol-3-phosphate acyltransferase [Pseudomonadota bacterium]
MTRSGIAAWRLLRCVLHALHGLAIVLWRFGALDAAGRQARIRWWSRKMLQTLGITLQVEGEPAPAGTRGVLLVANHISWLDVMAVHAVVPQARFVSKADVKSWPVISRLVDAAGTLYLERERKRDALRVVHAVAEALIDGQTVAVFPEGTTSDGRGLLPFHANLLQAAIAAEAQVQPVALRFSDADGPVSRAVEFIGTTTLAQSLWRTAGGERVTVRVALLPARPAAHVDRRALAQSLREAIADALGVDPGDRAAPPAAVPTPAPELAQG